MNPEEPLRKYLGFPETVMLSAVLTKHQVYTYNTDEEVMHHWNIQLAIYRWLAYEIDIDFAVWEALFKSKKDPPEGTYVS